MSPEEVDEIFTLADVNKDGKLDYAEVSSMHRNTQFIQMHVCIVSQAAV